MSLAQTAPRLAVSVLDLADQVMPGATVILERTGAEPRTTTTDGQGQAVFDGLPAGDYTVHASLDGFGEALPISVRTGRTGTVRTTVRLGSPTASETVTVGGGVRSNSPDTTVGKEDVPQSLSVDQDLLQSTIDALAGVGSTIRVDGLTSGGLPPASTIQQIRIRQNAYDAEFHEATPSFVEIVTSGKPSPWQGTVNPFGRLEPLQARNAFNPDAPSAQQQGLTGSLNGNIANRASVVAFGNYNHATEAQPLFAQLPTGPIRGVVDNPTRFDFATIRIGIDNWRRQNLRVEGDYQDSNTSNVGVGGFNLAERGYRRAVVIGRLRAFWTSPLRHGGTNVLRTQLQRQREADTPTSLAPAVVVLNAFTEGGAQLQGRRLTDQIEVSDVATVPLGKRQVWRSGLLYWHGGYDSTIVANAGGTFTFSSLDTYLAGQPADFTQRVGNGACCFGVSQLGLWTADDVVLSKTMTFALGLRQESESDIRARAHLEPRAQLEWSPPAVPQTTFRIGAGVFYSWLNPSDIEQTVRVDGVRQQDVLIDNPEYPVSHSDASLVIPSGRYERDPSLNLPRLVRSSIGIDHTRGALVLHVDYTHQTGTGLFRAANLNALDDTGVRPDPQFGNVIDVQSSGRSTSDAVNTSVTYSDPKRGRFLRMNYRFAHAYDNSDGPFFVPVDATNPDAEWGPSAQDIRHQFGGNAGSFVFTRHFNVSTFWQFSSALPYTITTGVDTNGDGIFNERPIGVGRNSARGFAQFNQGVGLNWSWPASPAPPAKPAPYSTTIWLTVTNVWNRVNRTAVSSVLTSPYFGQPISAGQPRRIYLGLYTTF